MADQLSGVFFDDGPAAFLHTPNLSRLAEGAVRFANAYCASPLCAPSRAAFMSACLPAVSGVYDNAAEFPAALPTFAHYLRRLGYCTALSGKMHFVGPDQLHGFEERLTTDIYPADFGWTPDWRNPHQRIDWWYHNLGSVAEAGVAATTNQLEFDDDVAYLAKQRLYQLARQGGERPFCLTVSFTHPHDPYVTRSRYWDLYPEVRLPPPSVPAIPYRKQDPHSRRLYRVVDHTRFDLDERQIAAARRAYFANISYLDERIGEILAVARECGFVEDTIVLFCADHGDMLGERGLWFKMSFFEPSVRVPLWLHAPERWRARRVAEPVTLLDVLPTLVELAGGATELTSLASPIEGYSLLPLLEGEESLDRPVYAEYAAEGSVDPMLMIRDGRWKFNYCEADPPQLFDLGQDPRELYNLAADPAHAATLARFTEQVKARWDVAALRAAVRRSQARRLLVYEALRQGEYRAWDYQPLQDASQRYMRNHLDLNALEASARFPRHEPRS